MTKRLPLRRAGAAALGAALIGFGAVRYDLIDWDQEPQPPPDPKPDVPQNPRKLVLPEPKFGWPVGQQAQDPAQEVRETLGRAARERRNRAELLSSTSDRALLAPPASQAEMANAEQVDEPGAAATTGIAQASEPAEQASAPVDLAELADPLPEPQFGLPPETESESVGLVPVVGISQLALNGPAPENLAEAIVPEAAADAIAAEEPALPAPMFASDTIPDELAIEPSIALGPLPDPSGDAAVDASVPIAAPAATPASQALAETSAPPQQAAGTTPVASTSIATGDPDAAPFDAEVAVQAMPRQTQAPVRIASRSISDSEAGDRAAQVDSFLSKPASPRPGTNVGDTAN
ncbi:MAG: hypothetical protein EP350_00375, partial [Alphaproteobacteria bacterium]